jgi:xanthine dehydrogenase YagT iron-sulfur-binding subunit
MPNDFKTPEEQVHDAQHDERERVDATTKANKETLFGRVSRRSFLTNLMAASGAAGVAATATPLLAAAPAVEAPQEQTTKVPGAIPVTLNVNGKEHQLEIEPRVTLLDCLRENLNMPGTKKGCDHGQCGACTVHVNGRRVNSCLSFAMMHTNDQITTIEGLGQPGNLHAMQAAFVEHDGYQCGYCTSGQIMSAVALLKEPCGPSDEDVKNGMYGNICRCGAYPNIVAAVQAVRRQQA